MKIIQYEGSRILTKETGPITKCKFIGGGLDGKIVPMSDHLNAINGLYDGYYKRTSPTEFTMDELKSHREFWQEMGEWAHELLEYTFSLVNQDIPKG